MNNQRIYLSGLTCLKTVPSLANRSTWKPLLARGRYCVIDLRNSHDIGRDCFICDDGCDRHKKGSCETLTSWRVRTCSKHIARPDAAFPTRSLEFTRPIAHQSHVVATTAKEQQIWPPKLQPERTSPQRRLSTRPKLDTQPTSSRSPRYL